jgi:hypothetical protein
MLVAIDSDHLNRWLYNKHAWLRACVGFCAGGASPHSPKRPPVLQWAVRHVTGQRLRVGIDHFAKLRILGGLDVIIHRLTDAQPRLPKRFRTAAAGITPGGASPSGGRRFA